ncbi:MAG: hypothetical protein AB8H47_21090 [Bacteroidia bacterium]
MATIINPEIKTILQNEPTFAGLEYEALRQLGLEHIGNLSGRIWTDHNVHDPGITTLEMLCYALLDLGYRTKLPIGQILAPNPEEPDSLPQFFSPAQILSSEPTTILDYRRLLLDIPGVKNAWLEVVREEEIEVVISDPNEEGNTVCTTSLNGLYRIILQLETAESEAEASILTQIRQTLLSHRNLGEDFINLDCPVILQECPIALSSQIEIDDTADPATVFRDIVEELNQYFCPQLHYYTLGELLAKGKQIEEIYAGRPYTTDSFGFIDPEELLSIRQQKEIHFSDLYSLILKVDGVKRIRDIKSLKNLVKVNSPDGVDCQDETTWLLHLPENTYPIFDLEKSDVILFRKKESYTGRSLQESKIFRQALNDRQKVRYHSAYPNLDLETAKDTYREDLSDYYSIQHEFPKVYGIGSDGLGPTADAERQAKALQFKGYLLFFERLLADFLSQLGSIKSYFALIPESERPQAYQQTYFAQSLDSVPQIEKLNRLSGYAQQYDWTVGKGIARLVHKTDLLGIAAAAPLDHEPEIPAFTFEHLESRTIAIQNIKTAFQANQDIHIVIAVNEFGEGFRFGIYFDAYEYAWLSEQNYATESEARNAATLMGTQLAWPDSLRLLSEPCHLAASEGEIKNLYSIQWVYAPPEELSYLQLLMESPRQYQGRRHQFLDHLLARFAEQFTDYSLQMYAMFGTNQQTDTQLLEVKSQYLSRFDRLSHDRAHAFDYGQNAWGADNLSGLEANLAARLGINWESRQSLCPFIPVEFETEYELKLRANAATECLYATRKYTDPQLAYQDLQASIVALRQGGQLQIGDGIEHSNMQISLDFAGGKLLSHELFQDSLTQQLQLLTWDQQFREAAKAENTAITRYAYRLKLKDILGEMLLEDKDSTDSEAQTWLAETDFIKTYQDLTNQKPDQNIKLIPYPGNEQAHLYFDLKQLDQYLSLDTARYRWQIRFNDQVILTSEQSFTDQTSAEQAILTLLASSPDKLSVVEKDGQFALYIKGKSCAYSMLGEGEQATILLDWLKQFQSGQQYVKRVDQAFRWQLIDPEAEKELLLEAPTLFADKSWLERSWSQFKASGTTAANYKFETLPDGKFRVELKNPRGEVIARSPQEGIKAESEKSLLTRLQKLFQRKTNSQIISVNEAYAFQLADDQGNISLQSFRLYLKATEAWETLIRLPKLANTAKNFVMSGDEANLNYSFFLQDAKGAIIAIHPNTYEEASVSKAQVKITKALLKAFQVPYQTQAEYRFLFTLSQGLKLAGSKWYPSPQRARAEGKKKLSSLAHPDFTQQNLILEQGYACVVLKQNDHEIARSQGENTATELKASLQAWDQQLQQTALRVDIHANPDQWQFRYYWPKAMQSWELLLKSGQGYDTELAAQTAYVDFVRGLPGFTIAAAQDNLSFTVSDKETLWAQTEIFDSPEARTEALNWLSTQSRDTAAILALEQVSMDENGDLPASLNANIFQTPLSREGVFGYQVIKKESPLAVLQWPDARANCTDEECTNHWSSALNAEIFPDIIRDGEAYRLINGLFHYEIAWESEGEAQVYLVSEKGYASAAEAVTALTENYIQILYLACDSANYAPSLEDRNGRIVFGEPKEADCPQDFAQGILAFVPSDTVAVLGATIEDAVSFLTAAAERFPLKQQENICVDGEVVLAETTTFYFRLALNDGQGNPYYWQSYQNYQSPEGVLDAWCEFLAWKDYREGYHCFEDWTEQLTCEWEARSKVQTEAFPTRGEDTDPKSVPSYCAIYEVLLESSVRHGDIDQVWHAGPSENSNYSRKLGVATLGRYGGIKTNYLIYWDYTLNSYRVSVGTDGHQLVEHPESFQQPEDRDQRLQWLVQNPAYTQLSYDLLNSPSDIYQNESVIISAETLGNYRFYIYAADGDSSRLAWRSRKPYSAVDYGSDEEAKKQALLDYNSFCQIRQQAIQSNWGDHSIVKATQDSDCGPYRIVGLIAGQEVANYPMTLDTFEAATQLVEQAYACLNAEGFHLMEHILFRPRTTSRLDDCLSGLHGFEAIKGCEVSHIPDLEPGECECIPANIGEPNNPEEPNDTDKYVPLLDPLSFWGTLVLPKWSYRYQFENFRELLLDELNAYAPAHMAFKICWLPPQQMCEFEADYRLWLKALKQTKVCGTDQADSSMRALDECTRAFLEKKYCKEPTDEERQLEDGSGGFEEIPDEQFPSMQTRSLGPAPQRAAAKPVSKPKAKAKPKKETKAKAKTKPKKEAKAKPKAKVQAETPVLSKREKTRLIRQRLATHQAFLKGIENKNVLKSGSYKRLEVLFSSLASPTEIKAFVDFLFQYPLKKKTSKSYPDYLPLLYQAISFGLDQSLIAPSAQSLAEWPAIIKLLKAQKVDLKALKSVWNPQEMKPLVEAERLNSLEALMKK